MSYITRRALASLLTAGAVAACTQASTDPNVHKPTPQQTFAKVAADINLIASGLAAVLPQLSMTTGLSSATTMKITAAIEDLKAASVTIQSAVTQSQAQSIVNQVQADVTAVLNAASQFHGLPPSVSIALSAASLLLPVLFQAVNMAVPPQPVAAARFAAEKPMSPDEARAELRRAAATRR